MKKIIFAIFCAFSVFAVCSCGRAVSYSDARGDFISSGTFSLSCSSSMTAKMADGGDDMTSSTVTGLSLCADVYRAVTDDATYYYKDGKTYSSTSEGKMCWTSTFEEFIAQFDFLLPLETVNDKSSDSLTLNGADYASLLLGATENLSWADAETSNFGDFTYSFECDGKGLRSYGYDYSVSVKNDGEPYADVHQVIKVEIDSDAKGFDAPDLSGYTEVDEGAFTEQVLYVIFEALYDEDGNKREDYDDRYAEFVEIYGEDTMRRLTEVADMFRE